MSPHEINFQAFTHANFLIYEMSRKLDLLENSPNSEYPYIGVCIRRWVSLKFHMGAGLLVYVLDVLTTCITKK